MALIDRFIILEWCEVNEKDRTLLQLAANVRLRAYAPYSGFAVGAALCTDFGEVFSGCNVEDVAFTGTMHAETVALGSMIVALGPNAKIASIAIVLGKQKEKIKLPPKRKKGDIVTISQVQGTPCGHCRTMLAQHASKAELRVVALQPNGQVLITNIHDLYPAGFGF